ncbi:MAG: sugar transferase [Terracidiphilus sp.]
MPGKSALTAVEAVGPEWNEQANDGTTAHEGIALCAPNRSSAQLTSAILRASSLRYVLVKRALDIALSCLLLVALFPLGLLIALLVVLTSRGPVFYRQERIGRFGVPFQIIKFRSMYSAGHKADVLEFMPVHRNGREEYGVMKRPVDPRVTPVGRLIRKLSLDELPQLFNVIAGDMSLVGPRPIIEAERPIYGHYLVYYDLVSPGITGLWQVSGRSDVGYEGRILLDRDYASGWSCLLDIRILARTIPAVITMRGAY